MSSMNVHTRLLSRNGDNFAYMCVMRDFQTFGRCIFRTDIKNTFRKYWRRKVDIDIPTHLCSVCVDFDHCTQVETGGSRSSVPLLWILFTIYKSLFVVAPAHQQEKQRIPRLWCERITGEKASTDQRPPLSTSVGIRPLRNSCVRYYQHTVKTKQARQRGQKITTTQPSTPETFTLGPIRDPTKQKLQCGAPETPPIWFGCLNFAIFAKMIIAVKNTPSFGATHPVRAYNKFYTAAELGA